VSFGRRIPPPTRDEAERERLARAIGCICCYLNDQRGRAKAPSHDTKQHCNLGGRHGAPNRGERYTFIACAWHHQGELPLDRGYTTTTMTALFGPSLAKGTKPFRLEYGTDDELIALTDQLTGFQP
jgi:hypothetical protein